MYNIIGQLPVNNYLNLIQFESGVSRFTEQSVWNIEKVVVIFSIF